MTRIPNTTAATLPEQTVVMLKAAAPGREQPLNLHAQMAHAPALLAGWSSAELGEAFLSMSLAA